MTDHWGEYGTFITVLILSSVIILGFVVSVVTEYFISYSSLDDLREKRKLKKIKKMQNHTIVCGFGRNGQQAVQKLSEHQKDFIVIDKNNQQIGLFDCSTDFIASGHDKVVRASEAYNLFYKTKDFDASQYFVSKTL